MKRILLVMTIIITICLMPFISSAGKSYVNDEANLLSGSQVSALETTLAKVSKENNIDVAVVTVYGLGGETAESYADLYFEDNYGDNGAVFLVDMESREWHISTSGTTMYAVNDDAFEMLEDDCVSLLSDGDFYQAFTTFANDVGYVQGLYNEGKEYKTPFGWLGYLLASLGIGTAAGFGNANAKKKQLKSVKTKKTASGYEKEGTLNLTNAEEIFLYSSISSAPIVASTNSIGGGGPTHTSSTGVPHGGGGGHF